MDVLKAKVMPEWYTRVLTSNLALRNELHRVVREALIEDSFLTYVFQSILDNSDSPLSIEQFLNSNGYQEFVKRITHLVLAKVEFGSYNRLYREDEIGPILKFERHFRGVISEGRYRLQLLGLYLYLTDKNLLKVFQDLGTRYMSNSPKAETPDINLICLYSLEKYHSKEEIEDLISGGSFKNLFSKIDDKSKDFMMRNILKYSFSINNQSLFIDEEV